MIDIPNFTAYLPRISKRPEKAWISPSAEMTALVFSLKGPKRKACLLKAVRDETVETQLEKV